jgi:hypothetical protein
MGNRLEHTRRLEHTPRLSPALTGVELVGEIPDPDVVGLEPDDDIRASEVRRVSRVLRPRLGSANGGQAVLTGPGRRRRGGRRYSTRVTAARLCVVSSPP